MILRVSSRPFFRKLRNMAREPITGAGESAPVTHCAQSANSLRAPREEGWKGSTYKSGLVYQSRDRF